MNKIKNIRNYIIFTVYYNYLINKFKQKNKAQCKFIARRFISFVLNFVIIFNDYITHST